MALKLNNSKEIFSTNVFLLNILLARDTEIQNILYLTAENSSSYLLGENHIQGIKNYEYVRYYENMAQTLTIRDISVNYFLLFNLIALITCKSR